ncbi:MAG: ankyrin repeat domain-containing protein [Alphaproteobacteria bacterium]|nr:ankyrin repeat domain-containing protein [Alphaproteobacteria bacterium]
MSKVIKWTIAGVCIFFAVIGICGYIVYANRAKIADKAMTYAVQSLTGSKEDGTQTWLGGLLDKDSAHNINKTLLKAVLGSVSGGDTASSETQNTNKTPSAQKNRKPGLATMAEMFLNGAGEENTDLGRMAQALVESFGGSGSVEETAVNDINARDTKGRTLLMNVCRVDVTPKVIKMLLRYGADIDAVDGNGRNALMYAIALNENPEVVQILLENGADAKVKDLTGKTAMDYAKTDEMRRLIEKYLPKKGWF